MSDIKPTSEVEEKYVIFTLNKQISVHFIRWLILDTDEYQYYLLVMGGRRCEGLSGVTKWSSSRAAVCVDLLYRCMVGALSVCTVPVPCVESHAVISDELGSTTWLMAFLYLSYWCLAYIKSVTSLHKYQLQIVESHSLETKWKNFTQPTTKTAWSAAF